MKYFLISSIILISSCSTDFDKAKWDNDPENRYELVDDLTDNILPGKSRTEIIELLGKPNEYYFKDADLVYRLGMERSYMAIDSEWILIYLNENGIYDNFEIKTD